MLEQLTKLSMLLLEGIENVSLSADNSSPILGPVGELNSTYSVNNHNPNTLKIEDSNDRESVAAA